MKKIAAILTAALMLLSAVPAFAFTGFNEEPPMPEIASASEEFFPASLTRYENEPEVTQTPWGETQETWIPMAEEAPIAAGDTVTFACEIEVPAEIEGFDAEALASIETVFAFEGVEELEIVQAEGGVPNSECNFDAGYCYPLPGYENIVLDGSSVVIFAELDSHVTVIVQGTVSADEIACDYTATIGQYQLPAHFSCGKLSYEDGCYFIYEKDLNAIQLRGMKFFTEDGVFDHYTVYFNNRDYVREADDDMVIYYEVGHEDDFILEGEAFDALERAYHTYMDLFGFTDDEIGDVMTDSVFLNGCEPVRYETELEIGYAPADEPLAGDADGNGLIDTTDALLVLRAALHITDNAEELLANCDMDNNGTLDTTDALYILRMALHIG